LYEKNIQYNLHINGKNYETNRFPNSKKILFQHAYGNS
jgi:hypothetical protein